MKFIYCPYCGEKTVKKEIGDEGLMSFCNKCNKPLFDLFNTCVIVLAVNEYNEVALLRQSYVSKDTYVCIAGYIKDGETAETTAMREVKEEIGISPISIEYINSFYYDKKDMLMLGFLAHVKKQNFNISKEVDKAEWFDLKYALEKIKKGSIAMKLVEQCKAKLEIDTNDVSRMIIVNKKIIK